jgi:hypothetical protein
MTSPAPTTLPGDQLASTVCTTRVVVVRAPAEGHPVIACGGSPMAAATAGPPSPPGGTATGTLIGKRYVDSTETLELLCTCSGTGELTCDGVVMAIKAARPLPVSD